MNLSSCSTDDTALLLNNYAGSPRSRWHATLDALLTTLLPDCLLRLPDGTVTVAAYRGSNYLVLRIIPEGGVQTRADMENVIYLHRSHVPNLLALVDFACREVQDPTAPFVIEDGPIALRLYSAQLPDFA